ncbi:MAG: SDR family NAD(P)-dependent oxidoreductase [Phycisphaerales bacterium]|nr:SDR family NAD(P)-dependent oxidoreductase [Phycisphaerales bacterium]MCB9835375.1 SDR family NAD(P)-dependent oxidoreductase [Phycisphaera sp.]
MAKIDLAGKPIAITGASSGIGAVTALACAKAGMPVTLAARRTDKLETIKERIESEGGKAIVVRCDVASQDDCDAMVARTIEAFGSIYSVFANAGFGEKHDVLDTSEDLLREMFEINFFGTVHTIRAAAKPMLSARSGHMLICTSCLSALPSAGYSVYSATKSAQHHIGRALGVELASSGIKVTTVHPVRTRTEFFATMQVRQGADQLNVKDRPGQPAERVADAVVKALRKPRPEVWMSQPARVAAQLAAMFPRLTDRVIWKPRR